MSSLQKTNKLRSIIERLVLTALSCVLYICAYRFNNLLVSSLIFFAVVPLFFVAKKSNIGQSVFYFVIFGMVIYGTITNWMGAYHISALYLVEGFGIFWTALCGLVICIILKRKSPLAPFCAAFFWNVSEILRGMGFLGFPYATLPYALYKSKFSLFLASIGGSLFSGLVIIIVNALVFICISSYLSKKENTNTKQKIISIIPYGSPALIIILLTIFCGSPKDMGTVLKTYTEPPAKTENYRVAIIQPMVGRQKTPPEYKRAFSSISALSTKAIEQKPNLVLWHETAIVPPIDWHNQFRSDPDTYEHTSSVIEFLKDYPIPVLTGNAYVSPSDVNRIEEFNAAVLYDHGKFVDFYGKMKLVPFTETFPYAKIFPSLNKWVIGKFGKYWTKGKKYTIFDIDGKRCAAPVCFEDSFARHFSQFENPDFFVVMTNDGWANSHYMQEQHLAMSVYRAAENASIVLRATDSGCTAAIQPNGFATILEPEFKSGILYVDILDSSKKTTIFEKGGKNFDIISSCLFLVLFLICLIKKDSD